ncbi:MAG: hypothetical protein JXE07_03610 [Candidatus Aminicenantes bacterium]|nr:hypothetical protein [Candidatus Aminicenantes bacterium]
MMTEKEERGPDHEAEVELVCDGRAVSLNPFVKRIIKETVRGMVRSLGETPENPATIEIRIRQK